ncbi:MAG TPA: PIN domain-containing protein [Gemmatimonadaceae bacterium]
MAIAKRPARSVAVDTGALLALASSRDQYHTRALTIAERLAADSVRLVGHALILGELHGHLLRRADPATARRSVQSLLHDGAFQWVEAGSELLNRAVSGWIERFADQRFSLTDAVTFEIMREAKITHAFAFDHDFKTAGFELL